MDSSTELQHTLELAFHRAPVGLCVSRHRTIEICNEAFAQMFGYAQADLMGHSLARLYPSLDEFTHIGKLGLPVMQTTGTYSDERIMCRSDGALFWCHVAGRALDRADPFAHAVWMFEDISQRRPVGAALTTIGAMLLVRHSDRKGKAKRSKNKSKASARISPTGLGVSGRF